MTSSIRPFHLALPVDDLDTATAFYTGVLGCQTGRTASRWVDLNFFGHQLTLHLVDGERHAAGTNPVDGDNVPARHFGVVLEMDVWQALADRLKASGCEFLITPRIRFVGEIGEQATMFFYDPAGNALEFKSFADISQLFAS